MSLKESGVEKNNSNKNKVAITGLLVLVLLATFAYLQVRQNLLNKADTKSTNEKSLEASTTEQVASYSDAPSVEGETKRISVSDILGQDEAAAIKAIDKISSSDHVRGNLNAPVQLIVYGDFDCPSTASFNNILAQAQKEFGDKTVIAFRHYPLTTIHQAALLAANAAECAAEQGKFWEMSDAFFQATEKNQLFPEKFNETAKGLNLDVVKFKSCTEAQKYNDKILSQAEQAKQFGVIGTPTTFVNGQVINGATPMDDGKHGDGSFMEGLRSIINKQLAGR